MPINLKGAVNITPSRPQVSKPQAKRGRRILDKFGLQASGVTVRV